MRVEVMSVSRSRRYELVGVSLSLSKREVVVLSVVVSLPARVLALSVVVSRVRVLVSVVREVYEVSLVLARSVVVLLPV